VRQPYLLVLGRGLFDAPGSGQWNETSPNGSIAVSSFNLNGGQIVNMQLRTDAIKVAGTDLYTEFDKVCFGAGKK
jgi:hypothetical protein